MKITSTDVIRNGEKELMDAIIADLDWGSIETIFREKHHLPIEEDVEYKGGDIVIHNNEIAYRMEFEARVTLSVLLDREGNYLSVTGTGPRETAGGGADQGPPEKGYEDVLSRFARGQDAEDRPVSPSSLEPSGEGAGDSAKSLEAEEGTAMAVAEG
ncbi:MAG: hypothetical protein JXL84_06610 [Deltaproteobacteria bacterium]|nr:hypothetical protein [Deltaproteobacteria bacterium]